MAELLVQDTSLIAVADAIRAKAESTASIPFPQGFIDAIEAIGAFPDGITALERIEYTPVNDTTSLTLNHNLGVAPNFFFGLRYGGSAQSGYLNWCAVMPVPVSSTGVCSFAYNYGTSNSSSVTTTISSYYLKETTFMAIPERDNSKLCAGTTYVWYVGHVEGNWTY